MVPAISRQIHRKKTEFRADFSIRKPPFQSSSARPSCKTSVVLCRRGSEALFGVQLIPRFGPSKKEKQLFEDVDTDFEGIRVRLTSHLCDVLRFVHPPVCMSSEGIKQLPTLPLSEEKPTLWAPNSFILVLQILHITSYYNSTCPIGMSQTIGPRHFSLCFSFGFTILFWGYHPKIIEDPM